MAGNTTNLIDQTVLFWRKYGDFEPTKEDARVIVENICGFFKVLAEWDRTDSCTRDRDKKGNGGAA